MRKIVITGCIALLIGLLIGFFVGRMLLERDWAQPFVTLTVTDEKRTAEGADPTPKAGTRVLRPMPIQRARRALTAFTEKDPVVARIAAVGSGDKGQELHVMIENRGTCSVTDMSGVAYGFDAYGHPARINRSATYLAFSSDAGALPGKTTTLKQPLRFAELATNAIAHVDEVMCADGATWRRP